MKGSKAYAIVVSGFALFAMYFGAGNLIFPVMIGYNSGAHVVPAIAGFILTGVLLPVIGMMASATDVEKPGAVSERIGRIPGRVLLIAIFLSTGMLYAIPRVAAVSFEIAVRPNMPGGSFTEAGPHDGIGLFIYTIIFFAVVLWLAFNPGRLVDRIGAWLTPALLAFLCLLIVVAVFRLSADLGAPSEDYAELPLVSGLLQGYFTMDALASLVFGVVIIASLRRRGFDTQRSLFKGTAFASVISGVCLVLVYLGLTAIGTRVTDQPFDNGAAALAYAATTLFGPVGQIIFGIIAVLACLTTAVGLTGASSQYFCSLLPQIPHKTMVVIHVIIALLLSNMGLTMILKIVAPVNQFIYPVTICLILIAVADFFIPGQFHWGYRLPAWIAAFIALFDALWATGLQSFSGLEGVLSVLPGGAQHMGWFAPALVCLAIGIAIDAAQGRLKGEAPIDEPVVS